MKRKVALIEIPEIPQEKEASFFKELDEKGMKVIKKFEREDLRYGENSHQRAYFLKENPSIPEPCIASAKKLNGKPLSYNNILDGDCAVETIKEFSQPTCVIIKHATPCGVASAKDTLRAWKDAFTCDKNSPFGGIVAFNRKLCAKTARELSKHFLEVVIAPKFSKQALSILRKKSKLRLLEIEGLDEEIREANNEVRGVGGGLLVQDKDILLRNRKDWKVVTKRKPTEEELDSMEFAAKCIKHVKSNSVLFAKGTRTIAIGGGQTARVDAVWIATHKGKENIKSSVMASDAFFPFRDGIDVAAEAEVSAIIQPGGSIRDEEVIRAADENNITMVFSGQRYFKH